MDFFKSVKQVIDILFLFFSIVEIPEQSLNHIRNDLLLLSSFPTKPITRQVIYRDENSLLSLFSLPLPYTES